MTRTRGQAPAVAGVLLLALAAAARADEAPRADRHGDPLPQGATGRLGTLRWRHVLRDGSGFGVVSVSPDGKYVASVGDVGLCVWDGNSGKEETWLKPVPSVRAAYFTPDGKALLTASEHRERGRLGRDPYQVRWLIQHWEPGTGKLLRRAEIKTSGRWTSAFAQFSPDGKLFMSKDGEKKVGLWDAATGERVVRIDQDTIYGNPLALSPDNKTLAVAAHDGHLYLYDVPGGKQVHKLPRPGDGPTAWHYAPAFSPDGKVLVTSGPKALYFWDVASGKLLHEEKGCRGPAAFSSDGGRGGVTPPLLACGARKCIHLFDATTFKEVRRFDAYRDQYVIALAFSANGKRLVAGQAFTVGVWDVATGRQLNYSAPPRLRALRTTPTARRSPRTG